MRWPSPVREETRVFRESLFAEVEFGSKPDVDECLGHLVFLVISLVPHSGTIWLYWRRKEASRINMSAAIPAFDWNDIPKSSKTNESTANHSWAPGQIKSTLPTDDVAFHKSLSAFMAVADCGYWIFGPKYVLKTAKFMMIFCGIWIALSSSWLTGGWAFINWIPRHLMWKWEN